jgi:Family of unknown function (DUF5670)
MLWTMAVILFCLWVLGLVSGAHLGLWIHLFFALALVCAVLALAGGARRRGGVVR